jgi:RNA polymerase sigma-70 factor (ECF subfamily)
MSPPVLPDLEALLAHAGWIRSLARSLVADRHRADDLVQQTFVAALEHPPEPSTPIKSWLGAVVRNFARQDHRADRRRVDRESASARPEATASAHETVEAVQVQRALFEAVLALDEPYRSSILQRYYEGLPPREIARRQRVPVKTVKTRLARGLERLRAALDRRHGGHRDAWLPALLPLAGWPVLPASTLGTLLVNTKIKIAAGVVALAGALAVVWNVMPSSIPAPNPPLAVTAPKAELERAEEPRGDLTPAALPSEREGVPAPPPHAKAFVHPPIEPSRPTIARGRVIDVEGRPVAAVPLILRDHSVGEALSAFRAAELSSAEPVATSRADGTFELNSPGRGGTLLARSSQFTTAFGADMWQAQNYDNLVVVVAPRGALAGVVVESDGRPIPNATLEMRVDRSILGGLAGIADQSFEIPWRATSDDLGKFELADAPMMTGAVLHASASGWSPAAQPAPERPTFDLRIVLGRSEKTIPRGEVVDALGRPVPGALVACNHLTTRTDAQGRFAIEIDSVKFLVPMAGTEDEIVALKEGFLPARFAKPPEGWPASVTLRLDGEPLAIRGQVVDESGAGMEDVQVWAIDEHGFGIVMEEVNQTGRQQSIESLLRGGAESVPTGRDGAFVLGGLEAGDYRLACMQRSTLLAAHAEHVPAGSSSAKLVLQGSAKCTRIAGRVVSRGGKPVEGVMLYAGKKLARWPFGDDPPFPMFGGSATTDAKGRFSFARLSPEGLTFQLLSPSLLVTHWSPPDGARLAELEIVVALRCHLQVELGDRKELAETFTVVGKDGEKIETLEYQGPMVQVHENVPIDDGTSPVVAVTEDAKTVVLAKGGKEVARLPITLVPGELKVLRP